MECIGPIHRVRQHQSLTMTQSIRMRATQNWRAARKDPRFLKPAMSTESRNGRTVVLTGWAGICQLPQSAYIVATATQNLVNSQNVDRV